MIEPKTALAQMRKCKEEFENSSRFSAKLFEYENKIVYVKSVMETFLHGFYVFNFIDLDTRLISLNSLDDNADYLLTAESAFVCRYSSYDKLNDKSEFERLSIISQDPGAFCSNAEWRDMVAFEYGRNRLNELLKTFNKI